jgi:hypothetical protein
MNKLLQWITAATMPEKLELAKRADSSLASLRLAAKGYRKDRELDISADFAARIETAAAVMQNPHLPELKREDMCPTCATCPYQIQCNTPEEA